VRSWLLSHDESERGIARQASRIRYRTFALAHHISVAEARKRIAQIDRTDLRAGAAQEP
jgi:hypothetical protein